MDVNIHARVLGKYDDCIFASEHFGACAGLCHSLTKGECKAVFVIMQPVILLLVFGTASFNLKSIGWDLTRKLPSEI